MESKLSCLETQKIVFTMEYSAAYFCGKEQNGKVCFRDTEKQFGEKLKHLGR